MFSRVPVFVHVTVAKPADTVALPYLLPLAEDVAGHVRAYVGGRADSVPSGDAALRADSGRFGLRLDSTGVRVVAHKDGTVRWAPVRTPEPAAAALLERALGEGRDQGELFIPANAFASGDTLAFTLDYVYPHAGADGQWLMSEDVPGTFQVFTLRMAREHPVQFDPASRVVPEYPHDAKYSGATAVVIAQFIVDTTGQAEPATFRDVWPANKPRPTGRLAEFYGQFVRAVRDFVLKSRYRPAEIAGCRTRQLVRQPFTFQLQR